MKKIVYNIIKEKIENQNIKEKMTKFLVIKKKRGTYQALNECAELEKEILDEIADYIYNWLVNEICDGQIKDKILAEYETQIKLELSRHGFGDIF